MSLVTLFVFEGELKICHRSSNLLLKRVMLGEPNILRAKHLDMERQLGVTAKTRKPLTVLFCGVFAFAFYPAKENIEMFKIMVKISKVEE